MHSAGRQIARRTFGALPLEHVQHCQPGATILTTLILNLRRILQ